MSPTEFSNYIKQRAMQQQLHHSHGHSNGHLGPIGTASPSRSISPNPLNMNGVQDQGYYFPNNGMGMYPPFNGPRNMFESPHYAPHPSEPTNMYPGNNVGNNVGNGMGNGPAGKFSPYLDAPHNYYGMNGVGGNGGVVNNGIVQPLNGPSNLSTSSTLNGPNNGTNAQTPGGGSPGSNQDNSKLLDGLNSFYSNPGPYQHLLVAN